MPILDAPQPTASAAYPAAIGTAGPEAAAAWDSFLAADGLQASTRKLYRSHASRFLRWLTDQEIEIAQVTPALIDAYLDSRTTCSQERMVCRTPLRRLFDRLAAHGVVSCNPLRPQRPEPAADDAESGATQAPAADDPAPTLADLKAFLFDLDRIDERSRSFRPGLVAMYPIIVGGMDPQQIAAFTGIPLDEVELYVGRLRENGIWTPDDKIVVEFDDPSSAEAIVELVVQIACAGGIFKRFSPSSEDAGNKEEATASWDPS